MWKEFKEFAVKGNAIDLAVAVIIGAAFGKIVTSVVEDLLMPPIGRIAGNLEESAGTVREIVGHAKLIGPAVGHINETGGVVAGALPLLYGMAEEIVADVTPRPEAPAEPEPARPASGTRRSRLLDSVGFAPRP